MSTISLTLSEAQIETLRNKMKEQIVEKTPPYALFQIRTSDCVITAYTSKKVVFQGEEAELYASFFQNEAIKQTIILPQCGSDEVGTGDYFGPVVVCAVMIEEKNMPFILENKITDSKQMNDDKIRELAPILMKQCIYSLLILENEKYNQIQPQNNLNMIKAKLHNQAYCHLVKKVKQMPSFCVIDQFAPSNLYFRYLQNEKEVFRSLHFETKAESKYPAVAVASMIARYAFLIKMDELSQKVGKKIPKGAHKEVDAFLKDYMQDHSYDDLAKIAKLHFKNTEKI